MRYIKTVVTVLYIFKKQEKKLIMVRHGKDYIYIIYICKIYPKLVDIEIEMVIVKNIMDAVNLHIAEENINELKKYSNKNSIKNEINILRNQNTCTHIHILYILKKPLKYQRVRVNRQYKR